MFNLSLLAGAVSAGIIMKDFKTYITQDPLKYELNGLEPIMSAHQLDLHYNKHHAAYVTNANKLLD